MPYANKWYRLPEHMTLEPQELVEWFRCRGGWRKTHGTLRLGTPWKKKKALELVLKKFKAKWGLTSNLRSTSLPQGGRHKKTVDIYVIQRKTTRNARLFFSKSGTEKLVKILKPHFAGEPHEWFD